MEHPQYGPSTLRELLIAWRLEQARREWTQRWIDEHPPLDYRLGPVRGPVPG